MRCESAIQFLGMRGREFGFVAFLNDALPKRLNQFNPLRQRQAFCGG